MKMRLVTNSIKLSVLASPVYFLAVVLVSIASGLSYGFITMRTQIFFTMLENINSLEDTNVFYTSLMLFVVSIAVNFFLNGLLNYLIEIDARLISLKTNALLHKKVDTLAPIFFEDASNLEKLSLAREGAFINGYIAMIVVLFFTSTIPSIMSVSFFLFKINFILGFVFIGIAIPNLIVFKKMWKNYEDTNEELLRAQRKRNTIEQMLTSKTFFKETRTLNIESFLKPKFKSACEEYEQKSILLKLKNYKLNFKSNMVCLCFYVLTFSYALCLLLTNKIGIADFGVFFTSFSTMIFLIENIFDNDFSVVRDSIHELISLYSIFDATCESKLSIILTSAPEIIVQDVSFCYPGAEKACLQDINFRIKQNQVLAIVGENGAGKTTLSKLLIGLYEPTVGDVKLDNYNTKTHSFFHDISVVNQNFCTYYETIIENIKLGSCDKSETELETFYDVNAKKLFPDKDLQIGREFGGVELSMGKGQRLAILRGGYKDSFYLVLDEPTASIDPESESEIIRELQAMTENRTAIVVTHRLAFTKRADKILVLYNGKQIEFGSFDELMTNKGYFYEMFSKQAQWYK